MIGVIFEVWPKAGQRQNYLDIAAALRPQLEKIDGFISIERFESLTEPGKILSLSFFRDDAAVTAWRNLQHVSFGSNQRRHCEEPRRGDEAIQNRHRRTGLLRFARNDEAIRAERPLKAHRRAQAKGRAEVFADYRLRIAGVVRDYGMRDRAQAPPDSKSAHG